MTLNDAYTQYAKTKSSEDYETFGRYLLRYVKQIAKGNMHGRVNTDELEDIVGNSLIKVFKNIEAFRGDSAFATWTKVIVLREGEDYIREKQNNKEQAFVGDEMYDPRSNLNQKILLDQLIGKLDPPERVLATMKREGYDDKEIAEKLGITEVALRKRWQRTTEKLRTHAGVEPTVEPEVADA